jgi:signal transduction histidine kinase
MSTELELQLRRLQPGQHLCLLYDSPADTWDTIVPYFREGLARGEQCLFVGDADSTRESALVLARAGIDVDRETHRGALGISTACESGILGGDFQPRAELERLESAVARALSQGFLGVRFSGEAPHALYGSRYEERHVVEFETLLNETIVRHDLVGICRYDLKRWPPALIRQVLRVHPLAVIGPLVCPNAYYEPPHMVLGRCDEEERVRWMIDQVYRSRTAKVALEQAVQARDDFLSAASHELHTPLTSTQLYVQSVLRRAESAADDSLSASWAAPQLRRATEQLGKLGQIIQGLLDAAQLRDPSAIELDLEDVDLGDVVRGVVAQFDDQVQRGRLTLRFDPPPQHVVGLWDRRRLEQVVFNLVSNAVKFADSKPVEVSVLPDGDMARLVVEDHGIGIAPEDVPRIFERFERGVPVRHLGGFGLGLWIAKRIVESLGGRISARGTRGAGATFTVELPRIAPR